MNPFVDGRHVTVSQSKEEPSHQRPGSLNQGPACKLGTPKTIDMQIVENQKKTTYES